MHVPPCARSMLRAEGNGHPPQESPQCLPTLGVEWESSHGRHVTGHRPYGIAPVDAQDVSRASAHLAYGCEGRNCQRQSAQDCNNYYRETTSHDDLLEQCVTVPTMR